MTETFAGDKKKGQSVLGPLERRFIDDAAFVVMAGQTSRNVSQIDDDINVDDAAQP